MATSGNSLNPITRDQLCIKALKKCGQLADGEPLQEEQLQDTVDDLNRIVKGFQADGVKLWAQEEVVLFLNPASTGQTSYVLGPNGDNFVAAANLIATSSTSTVAIGGTAITLASAAGILSGMNIGILCDDNSLFWTTVNGAPVGKVVTLTAGPIVQATNSQNVWAYATPADRPLRIEQARIQTGPTSEIELTKLSSEDYFRLPNKKAAGTPTQYYYRPTLNTGTFYIYSLPSDSTMYINATAYRPLQIFVGPNDTFDGPDEDQQGLIWALADEIKLEYGVDAETSKEISGKAQSWLARLEAFDTEEASLVFMPDFR